MQCCCSSVSHPVTVSEKLFLHSQARIDQNRSEALRRKRAREVGVLVSLDVFALYDFSIQAIVVIHSFVS